MKFTAPSFCNSSWPFDVAVLDDIRGDMDTYWPDIEVHSHCISGCLAYKALLTYPSQIRDAPNSLWDHEWSKHGTCAVGQVNPIPDICRDVR